MLLVLGLLVIGGPLAMHFYRKVKYAPSPSARVEGPHVVIRVQYASSLDEVRVGEHSTTDILGSARLKVPAEAFGAGRHEIEVELIEDGDVDVVKVPVDIPKSALEPFLAIGCTSRGGNQIAVTGDHVGKTSGSKCAIDHEGDRSVLLDVQTNGDAKLTVDDKPVTVEGGAGPMPIPLLPLLAKHLVVDDKGELVTDAAASIPVVVKVERPSGSLESTVTLGLDVGIRAHLVRSLDDGITTPPIPWLEGVGEPTKGTVLYVEQPFETKNRGEDLTFRGVMKLAAKSGTRAIDAGLVAVGKAGKHTPWVCKGYTGTGNLKVVVLTHELEVTVFDRGGKQVATRTFPQPRLDCPDYVSGKYGETLHYRQRAGWSTVKAWLGTVRG